MGSQVLRQNMIILSFCLGLMGLAAGRTNSYVFQKHGCFVEIIPAKNPNSIFQAHAFLNQEDCSVLYSRCSYVLANVLWSSIEKPEKWSRRSICTRHVTPVGSIKVQQRSLDVY